MMSQHNLLIGIGGLGDEGDKPPVPAHFIALGEELVRRGHGVAFLTWPCRSEQVKARGPFRIYCFPSPRPTRLADLRLALQVIQMEKPKAILANFGSVNVLMLAGWLKRVPVRIAWYHTLEDAIRLDARRPAWQLSVLTLRKRLFYQLCTHLVTVSSAGVKDLTTTFHMPISRIQVLHNTMPDPKINHSFGHDPNTVVCVGRFDKCKGQDVLIKAISLIHDGFPELRIKFIGDGPMLPKCKNLAHELGVGDHCDFLGKLPHQEVLCQVAHAAISIVPSRSDNLPSTVVESLAVGTPVIASNVGGIPDIFRDGEEGFLIPPEDPSALAFRMATLLQNNELRLQMGKQARARFLDAFETRKVIPAHADWLEHMLS